jgi:hypothetical protein
VSKPAQTGWGRAISSVTAPVADIDTFSLKVVEAYPTGGAPHNLRIVLGGATLKSITNTQAVHASQALSLAFGNAPDDHVFLVDTDAELCERAASACGAASAASLALLSTANWADFLRSLSDPVNGLTTALASPFPPKKIVRLVFTKVAKTRNEMTSLEGIPVFAFKPVNAAMSNIEQIVKYAHSRACGDGPLSIFMDAKEGLARFVEDHVMGIPEIPETIIVKSVLHGKPVAYMTAGDGIGADALATCQDSMKHAAERLL